MEKEFLDTYLPNRVSARCYDIEGKSTLHKRFDGLAKTGFDDRIISEIIEGEDGKIQFWKIGESLAECYLEDNYEVRFHYNSSRDAKNPKSSLTGADIVGFIGINGDTVFLFGEVKTSKEEKYPPHVWYGRSGMKRQLERIKDKADTRSNLIRWLMFKSEGFSEEHRIQKDIDTALAHYTKSRRTKFRIAGVLVRDVKPNLADLEGRYKSLSTGLNKNMFLDLLAIYLPIPVEDLAKHVRSKP